MDMQELLLWLQTTIVGINATNLNINNKILDLAEKESKNFEEQKQIFIKLEEYLKEISQKLNNIVDNK